MLSVYNNIGDLCHMKFDKIIILGNRLAYLWTISSDGFCNGNGNGFCMDKVSYYFMVFLKC